MSEQIENEIESEAPSCLFEVSWEVCNKVGGIYEVIISKLLLAQQEFGENYFLLGPDLKRNPDFEETNEPIWDKIRPALAAKDLKCRLGRWKVPGNPKVILVDFNGRHNNNQLLLELWEKYGVDSLSGGFDYQEPVLFSYTCGEVIATLWQYHLHMKDEEIKTTGHFHEWMCGAGILALKTLAPEVGTVFTTHATMLGRALASTDVDIYKQMKTINPKQQAVNHNITAKCSMETTSAREADCFTTVSMITSEEATVFLGRKPDIVTTNGLDLSIIPDYSVEREKAKEFRSRLIQPVENLLRRKFSQDLKIYTISGRYEHHNKGIDTFLEALAGMDKELSGSDTQVLVLCLVMGGHNGINEQALHGSVRPVPDDPDAGFISPFHVYNQAHDSILTTCRKLGLNNKYTNNVQVIFVPAMLDGNDGFFNMEYFEILAGCDLGVFPSWYEPWGYTPHESAAYGVPTVTTDLSGFGIWTRELEKALGMEETGVNVLPRHSLSYEEVTKKLEKVLLEYAHKSEEEFLPLRTAARKIAAESTWEHFYPLYIEAYKKAEEKSSDRGQNLKIARKQEKLSRVLAGSASTTPLLRKLTAIADLPQELSRLRDLANNLWWTWQPGANMLFDELDPYWRGSWHNPKIAIDNATPERLKELVNNPEYMELYAKTVKAFDEYMAVPIKTYDNVSEKNPIAYFCCEFGIHESLPIYSGGLGVLAGDHMKSVSDLAAPIIGIGLLYRNGYFRQKLDDHGRQVAVYPYNDFSTLAVSPVCDDDGNQIIIDLELPGRVVYAAAWIAHVGRAKLYLLDTDINKNTDEDRYITARLYEADRDTRLRQEIVLGMGGVRLCQRMGISPSTFHMNEGHSAFLILERIRKNMHENNMSLEEAIEVVKSSCVFTTHTPVDAGNERFDVSVVERYFAAWAKSVGMPLDEFIRLGKIEGHQTHNFDMTVLALRFANKANGVSWLHGDVSRRMWRELWKGLALAEVPIGYVTNGVHTASFVGQHFNRILNEYVDPQWAFLRKNDPKWDKINSIPDDIFWEAKLAQKQSLVKRIRQKLPEFMTKYNIDREYLKTFSENLKPETLIVGFARRFAPYKRATLLFANPDRLEKIINQTGKPIIFIFAGKSHPADEAGIDLMQEVVRMSQEPRFMGKIFFMEDYSLAVSKTLIQGCDVWLNNPRRPYEASGTSGQKIPVNGGVNFSISDGWWVEGYDGSEENHNGWTIGPVVTEDNLQYSEQDDYADAESLYAILKEELLPTYYDQNDKGLPTRWIRMAKNSMRTLTAIYSTHRMVSNYITYFYRPTAEHYAKVSANNYELIRSVSQWKKDISAQFGHVKIEGIQISGMEGDVLTCGQSFDVTATVFTGNIPANNLSVQLVIGHTDGDDFTSKPEIINLTGSNSAGKVSFSGTYVATKNGHYAYGVRVIPHKDGFNTLNTMNNILWG